MANPAKYVFADHPGTGQRHGELVEHLAAILDPFTAGRLAPLVTPSSRCLEIGAGAGTIALWLAERAADVVATDLDISHLPTHPNLTARVHDIAADPLDEGGFDLIHARLVLGHQPQRHDILTGKLIPALAPGGVLVIEEFIPSWDRCVLHTPDPQAYRLFTAYQQALVGVLAEAGNDTGWGRGLHHTLTQAGLTAVDTELWARAWRGGEPGALLPYTLAAQVKDKLIAAGMTAADLTAFRALLTDPRLVIYGNLAVSSYGYSPVGSRKSTDTQREPAGGPPVSSRSVPRSSV